MASALEYEEFRPLLFNSDDILTSYYPDQRQISLENTQIIAPPGQYFRNGIEYGISSEEWLKLFCESESRYQVNSCQQD